MISHKDKFIFIHIPKSAGKSIKGFFGIPFDFNDYKVPIRYIEKPYRHRPITEYMIYPQFKEYFKFAFVRNPYYRLVSAFTYLNKGGINKFDKAYREQNLIKYNNDFKKFVMDIKSHLNHVHFKPQVNWLTDQNGTNMMDFIGRHENIDNDFKYVLNRLKLPTKRLKTSNVSNPKHSIPVYDSEMIEIVTNVYRRDFEKFNYSKEPIMLN